MVVHTRHLACLAGDTGGDSVRGGGRDADQRGGDVAERRLAAYTQLETDAAIDAELRRSIVSGLVSQTTLPTIPVAPEAIGDPAGTGPARRRNLRRGG